MDLLYDWMCGSNTGGLMPEANGGLGVEPPALGDFHDFLIKMKHT